MKREESKRLNLLLITVDQQHFRLMSCAGDPHVRTPNLDRLAGQGVRFDRAYSANPVCVPARYSLMTGHMPHRFRGLETNLKGGCEPHPVLRECVETPPMGWLLRQAGYETAMGGKLHVEGPYTYSPREEATYGFRCVSEETGDGLASACAQFLREPHDRPFLLWASFDQPHNVCGFLAREAHQVAMASVPLPGNFAPTEGEGFWMRRFRDGSLGEEGSLELGLNRDFALEAHLWTEEQWGRYRGWYRQCMEQADRQIGVVLDALKEAGLDDRTVVIFTSDHGDHDGAHGLTMKRSFYEESVHVPLIIRHPEQRHAGVVDTEHLICNGLDLIPTLCDCAGSDVPIGLVGRSLLPLALGKSPSWRTHVVSEAVCGRMVRTARYKYCLYVFQDRADEYLFDLIEDPLEQVNLAKRSDAQPVIKEHQALLANWVDSENDERGRACLAALR